MNQRHNIDNNQNCSVLVVGNEKGGVGKTTYAMHILLSLMYMGYKVISIDIDSRQSSLTRYIKHRADSLALDNDLLMPKHFLINDHSSDLNERDIKNQSSVEKILDTAKNMVDYVVIDTPGYYNNLSALVHSYADKIITPVNDSFVDLDVIATFKNNNIQNYTPSIYSQMIWEQKIQKLEREKKSIQWIVTRNRLTNLDAKNKRNIHEALLKLSSKLAFKLSPGFTERVIFKELFLQGLTLLDLDKNNTKTKLSFSQLAAKQELRNFMDYIL
ncbi:division plane positioning ATPase MipZ [Rickettsia endosymbiont of Cardiosporidium cionae]|uniref:division plane positioning ATPase MipZ n=1 Tax=Rickettsia endosymbiont of Cardiosporidium cionae TaxID=2777155 RepID=UPI001895F8BA|nr:division plane positioning ATPase MipZ [Rickettsia endosymbiont of Cardiosporidium cionae]KAF8818887.1 ATPase [Rickettsia endosymbiont of Cardiosporidium cionae]